ncbi:DUF6134 family protein [Chitinophaga arvensicola]|uniref:GLPGLI family protein n=1 Tax=Chitinophaga arvensicola TaxID=29529 RepID=A0A1I0NJ44_9BACT|nr:DUF6134 family protein [Chitinophaga arvensicola]SEW01325.1 hypothetical protein SAMN04488122_0199 [Chitinophaga arvensicola]
MNSLLRVLFSTITVAVLYLQANAQTNTFEVRIANHAVGTIEANRKLNGGAKSIIIKTRIQIMLSKINSDIINEYSNNVLTNAKSSRISGKTGEDKQTTTRRNGKEYTIMVNGEKSVIDNAEIEECVADLYFAEPKQINRVFSETLGRFLPVKSLGGGVYELILPEGKKNVFKYENGTLVQVEVNHTLGKAVFVKIS